MPTPVPDPRGSVKVEAITNQLNQARVDILKLKNQLYGQDGQALDHLLQKETANASEILTTCFDNSNGIFRDGYAIIKMTGKLNTSMIRPLLTTMFHRIDTSTPPPTIREFIHGFFFPSHPEHYQLYLGNMTGVTETLGGIPTRTYLDLLSPAPDFVMQDRDLSYIFSNAGRAYLDHDNKTTASWTLQQFKDTGDGIDINLRVWYPAACPDNYIHDHVEHLCIEYRNSLRLIAALLGIE